MREAYAARAGEYAAFIDGLDLTADSTWIETWARSVRGPLLDLGCGPGHWSARLAAQGHDVRGVDPTREFIDLARARHPEVRFDVGGVEDLAGRHRYGGILAWYSLIHLAPGQVGGALTQMHEALPPGGSVLLGFFDGPHGAAFDHAVTTAYTWSAVTMAAELSHSGWRISRVQHRQEAHTRPHASIAAVTD